YPLRIGGRSAVFPSRECMGQAKKMTDLMGKRVSTRTHASHAEGDRRTAIERSEVSTVSRRVGDYIYIDAMIYIMIQHHDSSTGKVMYIVMVGEDVSDGKLNIKMEAGGLEVLVEFADRIK